MLIPRAEHLIDQGGVSLERSRNLFRFCQYVKALLPSNDINIMLVASKTFGRIVETGEPAFGEGFMINEVPAAIQLMQADKQEFSRYAGVLILKELARNQPTTFYNHMQPVFESITTPLRDPRIMVREGASELLAACLEILASREKQPRSDYIAKMAHDASIGLKASQPETIHGSLLVYRELFLHGGSVRGRCYQ
jgi:FKBP12-rapamycin complex-associated protein